MLDRDSQEEGFCGSCSAAVMAAVTAAFMHGIEEQINAWSKCPASQDFTPQNMR